MKVMRSVGPDELNEVLVDFLTCRDDMVEITRPTDEATFVSDESRRLLLVCTGELSHGVQDLNATVGLDSDGRVGV